MSIRISRFVLGCSIACSSASMFSEHAIAAPDVTKLETIPAADAAPADRATAARLQGLPEAGKSRGSTRARRVSDNTAVRAQRLQGGISRHSMSAPGTTLSREANHYSVTIPFDPSDPPPIDGKIHAIYTNNR